MSEHGHSPAEIHDRIASPPGRGILRGVIYGAIDGSVTTFAIVAGVTGAGLSPFVVLATFGALLCAGLVPLLPFVFALPEAFTVSAWMTLAIGGA